MIERVVVFGHPTLSRPVGRLLARDDVELVVVTPYPDWVDPGRAATLVTSGVRFAGAAQHGLAQPLAAGRHRAAGRAGPAAGRARVSQRAGPGRRAVDGPGRGRVPVRRLVLPGAGPRPGPGAGRPAAGLRQPRPGRHRREPLDRRRDRPGYRVADHRAGRRPDRAARPHRSAAAGERARPGPAGGGGQRRRRQHLRHPRAGRAGTLRGVRTALRHAARGGLRRAGRRGGRRLRPGDRRRRTDRGPGRAAARGGAWWRRWSTGRSGAP